MESFSKKEYLVPELSPEEQPVSDRKRVEAALATLGYGQVTFPLQVLRKLYPLSRDTKAGITATLVRREQDWVVTDLEPGDRRQHHYGLAVDYGSTNIVMQLVDLNSGAVIGQEQELNGQAALGSDILTRITYSLEAPGNREVLRQATADTFAVLLDRFTESTGIDTARCGIMVLSGNTTMIHFLLGLDAWPVFAAPYAPIDEDPGFFWGQELGIPFEGLIYIIPAASNYVGGDIVSGLLALGLHRQDEPAMFFDIGTNGELVIGNREWLLAGAGAAGPALEGYISPFGMRAAPGAVDSVKIRGPELTFTTVDGQKPVGICGSGILDLLAQMLEQGWINRAGELEPSASPRIRRFPEVGWAAVYAPETETPDGKPRYFSQQDIFQYLDTKAAAYTMVDCLLELAGIGPEQLGRCWLSGAFPAHSDLESAITVGIFPDLPRDRYSLVHNSSLEGAKALLLDRSLLEEGKELAEKIYCVQFASIPDFLIRMQAAKFLPHTDLARFPSAARREAAQRQPQHF